MALMRRSVKALDDGGEIGGMAQEHAPLAFLGWFHLRYRWRHRAVFDASEVFLDLFYDFAGVEIAHRNYYRVLRRIVDAMVIERVLQRQSLDIMHPADYRPMVGMGNVGLRLGYFVQRI